MSILKLVEVMASSDRCPGDADLPEIGCKNSTIRCVECWENAIHKIFEEEKE